MKIRANHLRFAQEYAIDLDGQAAAIRAGFSTKGAAVAANKLLKRPEVRAAVKRITDERAEKCGVKLDRVIKELARIAFIDPKAFYDKKGNLLPVHKMPEDARRALRGFDVDGLTISKVRFEKRAALEALLDYLAPKKFEHSGTITLKDCVIDDPGPAK